MMALQSAVEFAERHKFLRHVKALGRRAHRPRYALRVRVGRDRRPGPPQHCRSSLSGSIVIFCASRAEGSITKTLYKSALLGDAFSLLTSTLHSHLDAGQRPAFSVHLHLNASRRPALASKCMGYART